MFKEIRYELGKRIGLLYTPGHKKRRGAAKEIEKIILAEAGPGIVQKITFDDETVFIKCKDPMAAHRARLCSWKIKPFAPDKQLHFYPCKIVLKVLLNNKYHLIQNNRNYLKYQ